MRFGSEPHGPRLEGTARCSMVGDWLRDKRSQSASPSSEMLSTAKLPLPGGGLPTGRLGPPGSAAEAVRSQK